ncbi:hypothetical protein [Pseudomonas sp. NPDC087615]|uniref:hypothetical protein n=1 Tax=Pseudomonas sp. NPDC087615 TaxID=3364443 RepID=UPI0038094310
MREPTVQANQNLVLNGDFKKGTVGWKTTGTAIGVDLEFYDDEPIPVLALSHESWVSQSFQIPSTPGLQVQYSLSFLWQTHHTESGWLRIFKAQTVLHEFELKPTPPQDRQHERSPLTAGQSLKFAPEEGTLTLDSLFAAGDTLRIEIRSPKNVPNDDDSKIQVTRLDLQLRLEPLSLQELDLDGMIWAPNTQNQLYLCLGATGLQSHRLRFTPVPDSPWLDTEASLSVADNPQGAIIVTPAEDAEQLLTLPWLLDCPIVGDEDRYAFTLNLINRYNAEPCAFAVSLGHHRLVFRETRGADYYPVLGQSVRLGVQVASFYTGQPLDGRTIDWSVSGQGVKSAKVSDEHGWAWFEFETDTAGDVVVEASVDSPYYINAKLTETFNIKVLATDPWRQLVAVVDESERPWVGTDYPNRGSSHKVQIRLPDNTPLRGSMLSLHWSGDSQNQLGVEVSPALGEPVLVDKDDLIWTLTSADRLDGQFDLSLVSSRLLDSSPKRRMSLARNRVKIADVREANKSPVVDEQESVLLRVQVVHATESGDGEPVSNARVTWLTPEDDVPAQTGTGGWASLLYTPTTAKTHEITASVKAHPEAEPIDCTFEVVAIQSSPWNDNVRVLLDEVEVDRNTLGVLCRKGQTPILSVIPVPGSLWIDRNISLHWRGADPQIGLVPGDLELPRKLVAQGVQWTLDASAGTSSLFDLELRLDLANVPPRELSGRLVSTDLAEEVGLVLDQIRGEVDEQTFYPCLRARHCFNVLPNALSPLVGLQASLTWSGTPADELGATVLPALDTSQTLNDGGALWALDFFDSAQPGRFSLTLTLPQLGFVATAKPMQLDHNKVRIIATRESSVNPVVGQEPAWMWVKVVSAFTEEPVDQAPVSWIVDEQPQQKKTAGDGWSGFPFVAVTQGGKTIECRVKSPYDGFEESRSFTLTALERDPWDGLMVSFDGLPARPWGQTLFPRRKGQHRIDVTAEAGSALFDQLLTLGMTGTGPAELGIRFNSPGLGEPRYFSEVGLDYYFSVGDSKDGSFALCLASERLASLSPANGMSVGQGEQVMKIAERQRINQTLLWGAAVTEQVAVISTVSGKPMVGVTVTWRSPDLGVVTSTTNFYGVAKIDFVPTTPGAMELTASVGGAVHSDSISLPFFLSEPRQIKALLSDHPGGYPGQEISADVWVVSAITGEPLADVEVLLEYDNQPLPSPFTDGDGKATVRFVLGAAGEASLLAAVKGGLAGWDVKSLSLSVLEWDHAAVESVVASVNPVPVNSYVNMTAQIVDRESRQPMAGRAILVSRNGAPFIDATTDRKGQYLHYWWPMDTSEVVSLAVKVENADGSSDSGAVYVTVVS